MKRVLTAISIFLTLVLVGCGPSQQEVEQAQRTQAEKLEADKAAEVESLRHKLTALDREEDACIHEVLAACVTNCGGVIMGCEKTHDDAVAQLHNEHPETTKQADVENSAEKKAQHEARLQQDAEINAGVMAGEASRRAN